MKNIVIANWKMNPANLAEAKKIFNSVKKSKINGVDVVICPPFLYLSELSGLSLGAQNVYFEDKGAFTGEISATMLKDIGVEYVIVGHSERRIIFGETDVDINKKIKKCLEVGLKVIFCIGETKEQWQAHQKPDVLENQLTQGLLGITREEFKNIIVAYEPVWAIGTGNNCSIDETMTSLMFIRKIIAELYNREISDNTRVIYGGSAKSDNSQSYITESKANGFLVGAASTNPEEFLEIIKSAKV